jgi:hypothetical protein
VVAAYRIAMFCILIGWRMKIFSLNSRIKINQFKFLPKYEKFDWPKNDEFYTKSMHFVPLSGEQIYNFIRKINEIGYKFLFYL